MERWRRLVLAVSAAFVAFAAVADGYGYHKPIFRRRPAPKPSAKPPSAKPPSAKPPAAKPPSAKPPTPRLPRPPSPSPPSPTPRFKDCGFDVVDDLSSSEDFSIVVKLIKAAGLEMALRGPGPFTVLAPNNNAFKKAVGAQGLRKLLLPRYRHKLKKILKYHVIPQRRIYKHMFRTTKYTTLSGANLYVEVRKQSKMVRINKTNMITKANFKVCNGVVHVVQDVLLPRGMGMDGMKDEDRDRDRDRDRNEKEKDRDRNEKEKDRDRNEKEKDRDRNEKEKEKDRNNKRDEQQQQKKKQQQREQKKKQQQKKKKQQQQQKKKEDSKNTSW